MSPEREVAELLLELARADFAAAEALAPDARQADGTVGFHAQQTHEKAMKAVAAIRDVVVPHTHDLEVLRGLLDDHGIDVAEDVAAGVWLTPWAVTTRYARPAEPLDRDAAVASAAAALEWAVALVAATEA